ncbi:MAG: secondary thiamine-phosphate synthase enzyme YjbQ [Dehalococcoidales bacterium]|jgi:secondary thiamine-phosphate synthase enzyme|nr:secondary thiamine-phosphate synthase enzyme YjbQ [Dehalococcoidales bacterium]MDP7525222.1 secondary thiamine-phosphate synthase enzyme YjbQ [Dehalococcoidales bacterium]
MIVTREISFESQGRCDIIDITKLVAEQIAGTHVKNGTASLFVSGSTAGITTIEFEPGVLADLQTMWQRIVPENITYDHDCAWGDGNGYSHVRAALLGPSLVVPFSDKRLALGTWQQIVLVDFDNRPRTRRVVIQIAGE